MANRHRTSITADLSRVLTAVRTMINPNLKLPQEKIVDFCRRHQIKQFSLFGSATRDDFRPDSDIDVLVEFDERARVTLFDMVELRDELSEIFNGRSVDLVTASLL